MTLLLLMFTGAFRYTCFLVLHAPIQLAKAMRSSRVRVGP